MAGHDGHDTEDMKLHVSNIPTAASAEDLLGFFNGALIAVEASRSSQIPDIENMAANEMPVIRAEKFDPVNRTCFIIFKSEFYRDLCFSLNGINFAGYPVRLNPPHLDPDNPIIMKDILGLRKPGDGDDQRIFVQGFPPWMGDDDARIFLEKYGRLKVINLLKDPMTRKSKGYGFFEYEKKEDAEKAVEEISSDKLGEHTLTANFARYTSEHLSSLMKKGRPVTALPSTMSHRILSNTSAYGTMVMVSRSIGEKPSPVVQLLNVIFADELLDESIYQSVLDSARVEAVKYGELMEVLIIRPEAPDEYKPGVGKIFLHYADQTSARKAQLMLNGRKFDGKRVVCAAFYPHHLYLKGQYSLQ